MILKIRLKKSMWGGREFWFPLIFTEEGERRGQDPRRQVGNELGCPPSERKLVESMESPLSGTCNNSLSRMFNSCAFRVLLTLYRLPYYAWSTFGIFFFSERKWVVGTFVFQDFFFYFLKARILERKKEIFEKDFELGNKIAILNSVKIYCGRWKIF